MSKKAPRRSLMSTITAKAYETFGQPYPEGQSSEVKQQWMNRWVDHWLVVAEQYKQEMLAEGLTETAAKIQEDIDFNRRLHPR